ncbi:MAG: serine protease [Fibrobacterales bacterium]
MKAIIIIIMSLCLSVFAQEVVSTACDEEFDFQDVEYYDGSLGVSEEFVNYHQGPVGVFQYRFDIQKVAYRGKRICSGTLISEDLFLTAGHCFTQSYKWPLNEDGTRYTPEQMVLWGHVNFNWQLDSETGQKREEVIYNVVELVEKVKLRDSSMDYAILRLEKKPGIDFGYARIKPKIMAVDERVTVIQHPEGELKKIHSGLITEIEDSWIKYSSIDTQKGSSGSGVLDEFGDIVGIHTLGLCDRLGYNQGVTIRSMLEYSPVLKGVFDGQLSEKINGDINISLGLSYAWEYSIAEGYWDSPIWRMHEDKSSLVARFPSDMYSYSSVEFFKKHWIKATLTNVQRVEFEVRSDYSIFEYALNGVVKETIMGGGWTTVVFDVPSGDVELSLSGGLIKGFSEIQIRNFKVINRSIVPTIITPLLLQ